MKLKPAVAELFGTFGLTLAVLVSLQLPQSPLVTPVVAGLTLGLFVYTIGPVSGCHINPAVTLGLAAVRKVDAPTVATYLVAQFLGAGLALVVGDAIFGGPAGLAVGDGAAVGAAEALGALFFLFGIVAVVVGRVPGSLSGVVIGGSLTLGVLLAIPMSNGVLNPAVAFGIGSLSAAYVWGPVAGAVVGALISAWIAEAPAEPAEPPVPA